MAHFLDCKKVDTAIRRAKALLIKRAEKTGMYENFGQNEVRAITNKFVDISERSRDMDLVQTKIENFNNWCMTYAPRK